ncbi:MAG TPA: DUF5359 family protein [Bacillales bacterium]|nr:DUF5359 family protein [Bacillales bacterium]
MKTFERFIIKLVIIQFIFLLLSQIILQLDAFPQLKQITKYEGVTKNTYTDILETFKGK